MKQACVRCAKDLGLSAKWPEGALAFCGTECVLAWHGATGSPPAAVLVGAAPLPDAESPAPHEWESRDGVFTRMPNPHALFVTGVDDAGRLTAEVRSALGAVKWNGRLQVDASGASLFVDWLRLGDMVATDVKPNYFLASDALLFMVRGRRYDLRGRRYDRQAFLIPVPKDVSCWLAEALAVARKLDGDRP